MGSFQQSLEIPHRTQFGVDPVVITDVIAVVGSCLEDWIEIDGVDPQIKQVVQFLDHSPQISPLESP